jgi:TPR repeat protein
LIIGLAATVFAATTDSKNTVTTNCRADTSGLFLTAQKAYQDRQYEQAFTAFQKAADAGDAQAQYMTALMIYRGQGVGANPTEAARYYTLAARNNFPKAQYNLAILYYEGTGVERNDVEAYKWLYLANRQGEPRAANMLPVANRNLTAALKAQAINEALAIPPTSKNS